MSETLSRTVAQARRTSGAFLKAAARLGRGAPARREPAIEPANDAVGEAEPPAAAPSVIASMAEMTGTLNTPEELHVQGRVEGDLRASKIVVCAGGVVKGGLTAEVIIIEGAVEGRVEGHDVLLCGGAVVSGEITHRTLGIDTTVAFEGHVKRQAARQLRTATGD